MNHTSLSSLQSDPISIQYHTVILNSIWTSCNAAIPLSIFTLLSRSSKQNFGLRKILLIIWILIILIPVFSYHLWFVYLIEKGQWKRRMFNFLLWSWRRSLFLGGRWGGVVGWLDSMCLKGVFISNGGWYYSVPSICQKLKVKRMVMYWFLFLLLPYVKLPSSVFSRQTLLSTSYIPSPPFSNSLSPFPFLQLLLFHYCLYSSLNSSYNRTPSYHHLRLLLFNWGLSIWKQGNDTKKRRRGGCWCDYLFGYWKAMG